MYEVLSVLEVINVQTTHPDINLGGQGMVITNQGSGYPTIFLAVKTYAVLQNRPMGCVCKTGTKHASKDGIEIAILKAFREVLIEVLSFGFRVAELVLVRLLAVLFIDGFSLVYTVIYDTYKQTLNQE